ncbi:hypothetical protein [Micromonospora sp. NBC_01813]|uniref:hypothetical protein n=1 Tax=Micromonospora sp. NBC_01813 TaxID=2975988 RepID=UPI002DDA7524|nr:hypothetical protein [Micromonospora sp. NBC_01813]WSA08333.1 hypothetical protein OG958_29765 [Micromonospora sp. NBC_01813]
MSTSLSAAGSSIRPKFDPAEIRPAQKQPAAQPHATALTCPATALAGGVLLEFRLGDDVDQWPVDRAQALALTRLIPRLLRDDVAPRRRRAA